MSYGPRVPNTPLSMPLAQHTLPIFNTKSYIEWPQWKYKRVPGFGKVKLNDIVVFNFPAGDTVALNRQQEDFYSLAYREGQRVYPNKINMDSLTRDQQRTVYDLYYNAGRNLIRTNPQCTVILWYVRSTPRELCKTLRRPAGRYPANQRYTSVHRRKSHRESGRDAAQLFRTDHRPVHTGRDVSRIGHQ